MTIAYRYDGPPIAFVSCPPNGGNTRFGSKRAIASKPYRSIAGEDGASPDFDLRN